MFLVGFVLAAFSCSDSSRPDTTPPGAVTDLVASETADTTALLTWTAPGDDGDTGTAAAYDLRFAAASLTTEWYRATAITPAPVPHAAGTPETLRVAILPERPYWFALKTADESGNVSALSNEASIRAGDTTPPRAVTDLQADTVTETGATLRWTAPGDDGSAGQAHRYDVRYAMGSLATAWETATRVPAVPVPRDPGTPETLRVEGLEPDRELLLGLRTVDKAGNVSDLSNEAAVRTVDGVAPAAVTNLEIDGSRPTSMTLRWTAPGDNGTAGHAEVYDIRYATMAITEATWLDAEAVLQVPKPKAAGQTQEVTQYGLTTGVTYWFALKTVDEAGNTSGLSNVASGVTTEPNRTWVVKADGTGDAPTIQAAIDSSQSGDQVLVQPGTYFEAIEFRGRDILVRSTEGPEGTTLDGAGIGASDVVRFVSGETRNTCLEGFTIRGATVHGVLIRDAEPSIVDNVVVSNGNEEEGEGGIWCGPLGFDRTWSPLIQGNVVQGNIASNISGGIGTWDRVIPDIVGNFIAGNRAIRGDGGGIYLRGRHDGAMIRGNVIVNNFAGDHGGGVYAASASADLVAYELTENVIAGNRADGRESTGDSGGGVWLARSKGWIHHNTIVDNEGYGKGSPNGGGIAILRPGSTPLIEQNIIAFSKAGGGIWCAGDTSPTIRNNLAWMNAGGDGVGACPGWWQTNGNLVADPQFCDRESGDYGLAPGSPALTHPGGPLGAITQPGCGATITLPSSVTRNR